ncbi:hypothetical protein DFJ63DRAFT_186262 [Scheffersomyces coipomensis]|uniref:uncharacterized protein n=1 Tax=Scheffersomyces coipomensis TaxID=1788519 RepID=UPI00315D2EC2
MSNLDSFITRNRGAIAITALAGVSAVGAYYYYTTQQQQQQDQQGSTGATEDVNGSKKTKKSKKKKKTSAGGKSEESTPTSSAGSKSVEEASSTTTTAAVVYPVNSEGLPAITEDIVNNLSGDEKEVWALALKEDGNNEFKNKKFENAIAFYSAALQLKIDPIFYSNRSACYAALNDHQNVIADTTEAIKLKPDYTKCVLRRATSYEVLEDYPNAMFDLTALTIYGGFSNKSIEAVLERVLKKHSIKIVENKPKQYRLPSASTISSFFGAFVEDSSPDGISAESEDVADKYLFEALKEINANTANGYDTADTLLNQAVEAYNTSELTSESPKAGLASIALEYLSSFQFLKNDPAAAAISIEQAINLKPRARSFVIRALINADASSMNNAIQDFQLAKQLDPNSPDIYYQLGQFHYLQGELADAEANFNKAKELNEDNVYAYIQLACITYKNGGINEATEKFTAAKLKFATSPEVPNYYGEILADKGDIAEACKQFQIAARLQESLPNFSVGALPLINEATLISRESLEKLDDAEKLLLKACELDPKSELAKISLAQIKLQKDEVDEAILLFEESADLARTFEEKIQATSFAEASKMQMRIKNDPVLTSKINEIMRNTTGYQ